MRQFIIPKQNGVANCKNQTLVECARSMLQQSKLSKTFKAKAIAIVVYVKNLSPIMAMVGNTFKEVWTGSKPSISHLWIFGCNAHMHTPREKWKKFDSKSMKCIYC